MRVDELFPVAVSLAVGRPTRTCYGIIAVSGRGVTASLGMRAFVVQAVDQQGRLYVERRLRDLQYKIARTVMLPSQSRDQTDL